MELLSDLTTDTFLSAFKRFISRREKPNEVLCDNGATFKGAKNKLDNSYDEFNSTIDKNKVNIFCLDE